ncbi:MAG TPA: hypothetical protein EYP91_02930 [Gammaproteobacteria bacterium]|nr:hypothetical protein [Gammaproteobacteria bacterium]
MFDPRRLFAPIIGTILLPLCLAGEVQGAVEYSTLPVIELDRVDDKPGITIDGKLDEPVWNDLPAHSQAVTLQPETLAEPTYPTHTKFFYTERGLYIGVFSEQPNDTLIARLTSRDRFISRDSISVTIDPSGEGLYAYWFAVSLGDSLADGTILPERQFSREWDGAWRGASSEVEGGWVAEYFLPWSMITMPEQTGESRRIGFYITRSVSHLGERWGWPALPESGSRFMSALQPLEIDNITPKKQFTFYPYAATRYNVIDSEDDYKAGFDIFWRPSSNMQLTATVNPDFGNVESDDVVVNLTSFETFFPEKRPFFLEGQEIFRTTPRGRSRGRGTPTILVNTRRIGSPPKGLDIDNLELTQLEDNQPTELQGAAKITGQQGNWRYGVLAAVEDDTKIEGTINDLEVDLLQKGRDFGAARFLYESTTGNSRKGLGWITTLVSHPQEDAVVHGIDGHYLSENGKWNIDGQTLYSDVDDVSGSGAFIDVSYTPRHGLKHSIGVDYFDEDLDINDFGFLRRNDAISTRYKLEIIESDLEHYKTREFSLFLNQEYNTDGRLVRSGIFANRKYQFHSNHFLFTELNYFPSRWDDTNSAGNGDFKIDPRWQVGGFYSTDSAKKVSHGFSVFFGEEDIGGLEHFWQYEISWRPSDRFSALFHLKYVNRTDWLLHQSGRDFTTYEAEFWQPELELDYFLTAKQQFRITAQWVGIKAFERDRWQVPAGDGSLIPDTAPVTDTRDFSISRLVFQARYRWEIAPLSDLFVVYTRGSNLPNSPEESFGDLFHDSWTNRAVDVFVIKLRYRLGS